MAAVIDQAVVVRVWEFSETSQTVSLLCREHGVLRGLAKGSRRAVTKFGGGFELLTRGEAAAIVKPGAELVTWTEWDLQEIFWGPRRSLAAHRGGLYLADLVHHTILDHDPHVRIFDALVDGLREMSAEGGEGRVNAVLAAFQWLLLSETGYRPRLIVEGADGGSEAGPQVFDAQRGGVVGAGGGGAGSWRVRGDTIELLKRLERAGDAGSGYGAEVLKDEPPERVERAARLLSEHLRVVFDRDLPTRGVCFGEAGRRRSSLP